MDAWAQPLLDLIKAHSDWAAAVMFITAFGESFAFVSLLFPGTTVLIAAGTLLSGGTLPYASILVSAILGAVLGDSVSYWLGRRFGGSIALGGQDITAMRPDQRARAGIGWVPQERNIFRSLTVEENMTAVAQPGPWTVAKVYEMFPRLKERRGNFGNQLSGGEQQMLAIGRALTLNPKVLLLDEPTEGLAPIIVEELLRALGTITRAGGICSIIVEQNAQKILGLADRVVILERGAIVHDAASAALKADPAVLERFLGVSGAATH